MTSPNEHEAAGAKSFPAYPKYKDSGVEWLGEVPAHWEVSPVGSRFQLRNGYPFAAELFSHEGEENDRLIRIRDILHNESRVFTSEPCPSWALVSDGDVLIGMDGDFNVTYWDKGEAKLNQRVCALRGGSVSWDKFMFYGIVRPLNIVNDLTFSTTVKHLSSNQVIKMRFPFPPEEEVNSIAAFLDHETARIDALIAEQQRLIALLKEKRQAVISHAVTKGLDPDAPMKDSGVEWLGEVPAHWEVVKLSYLAKSRGGGTPPKDEIKYWNGNIPWVTPKDMKQQWITSTIDTLTETALHASPASMIDPGHVLIVFRSGILRHRIPVAINKIPVTVNQDVRAYDVSPRLLPSFFMSLIQGLNHALLPEWSKQGATVESLDSELVDLTQVPVPALEEQKAIIAFIDHETVRIDALINEGQKGIGLLQERRSALISAAVTGKIDVRDWQLPVELSATAKAIQSETV